MVAKRFGTMACAACLILAIVELVIGAQLGPRPWVPLWTVWVGIVISPLELPVLKECYQCVDCNKSNTSWCTEWEKFMLVTLRLKNWYLRGLFYAVVSPPRALARAPRHAADTRHSMPSPANQLSIVMWNPKGSQSTYKYCGGAGLVLGVAALLYIFAEWNMQRSGHGRQANVVANEEGTAYAAA